MSKKIVVIPTFAESHFVKQQIPNIIDTVNPDYIIYREGLFPGATEGKKVLTKDWLDKYTLDGVRAFDFFNLKKIIDDAQKKYPNTKIILDEVYHKPGTDSTTCYYNACTNLEHLDIKFEEGDYIFPYEGDVFHHEDTKKDIENYCKQIEPGQGFRSIWIDYMQNFWYAEKCRIKPWNPNPIHHRSHNTMTRRICIRYDKDGSFYRRVQNNFMTTDYHDPNIGYGMLFPTDLITYHYLWIRPKKFRELRCDQLQRFDGYWDSFIRGLDMADEYNESEITIRPQIDPKITSRWIKFHDLLPHPKHIKTHELWFEPDEETKKKLRGNFLDKPIFRTLNGEPE